MAPMLSFLHQPCKDYEHIRNLTREIETFKKSQSSDPINTTFDPINSVSDPINKFTDPTTELLYQAIKKDGTLSYAAYGYFCWNFIRGHGGGLLPYDGLSS